MELEAGTVYFTILTGYATKGSSKMVSDMGMEHLNLIISKFIMETGRMTKFKGKAGLEIVQ